MLIIGVIAILVIAITLRLASNKKKINEKQKPVPASTLGIPANVITLKEEVAENPLLKTGTLIPNKEADIMAVSGGKLVSVNFNLGSIVRAGAIVAQVDNKGLELSLAAAQLAVNKANKDFTRYQTLLKGEATTEVTFQDAKLKAEDAANQIEQIKKQMSDNRIKAPINGQIVSKLKENGEYVSPGANLGHIVDVSRLKANVLISEDDAYSLKLGQNVNVTTDIYPGKIINGKITFISNQADATHNYPIEITLDNPKDTPLKAGTFAYVDFNRTSHQPILMIPRSALLKSIQNPMVYVVLNNKAVIKKIALGRDFGGKIEVVSGLNAGDVVVVSGQINITEGSNIKAITTTDSIQQ